MVFQQEIRFIIQPFKKQEAKSSHNKTSSPEVVIAGVPQGSNEGLLLVDLFINDLILFLHTTVLSNYADDSCFYVIGTDKEEAIRVFVENFQTIIDWFYDN